MGYYVTSYLTRAESIRSVFGSKDIALYEKLSAQFKADFERHDNYFASNLPQGVSFKSVLIDIIYGEIRFPKFAFIYGYVYESLCEYYGEKVFPPEGEYSTNYYWAIPKTPKAFIPVPLTRDFPEVYSIYYNDLKTEKERFLAVAEIDGIPAEYIDTEKEDYAFIFDKAIAEKCDLVFFTY